MTQIVKLFVLFCFANVILQGPAQANFFKKAIDKPAEFILGLAKKISCTKSDDFDPIATANAIRLGKKVRRHIEKLEAQADVSRGVESHLYRALRNRL